MKTIYRITSLLLSLDICISVQASDAVRTGTGVGPLPRLGYDSDNGFYSGLQLSFNNYMDGKMYPNPYNTLYLDFSYYQKGIVNCIVSYDNKSMFEKVRICSALQYCDDNGYNFYGLNGYQSNYDSSISHSTFYSVHHRFINMKLDLVGKLLDHLSWEAGYHFVWTDYSDPGDESHYLYSLYGKWGIIPQDQISGGINSELRAGIVFDTRDSEASPSEGIWTEGHVIVAPSFLGTSVPYSKFCLNWRHYVPLYGDKLTFAYRLAYQGFLNENTPWYILPYYTVVGPQFDRDGIGGFRTLRGIMLNRIQGLHTAFFNTELRWRLYDFRVRNQDISLCLSEFFEGGKVIKPYDISLGSHGPATADSAEISLYDRYINNSSPDRMHLSMGAGLRFIFNRNFIIAFEWGHALNSTDNRWNNCYQDAGKKPSFYLNTGFTF